MEGRLVKISIVSREIRCLVHALRLAKDGKLIDEAPTVKLDSEDHQARDRVLSEDEYQNLLNASPVGCNEFLWGQWRLALARVTC